MCFQIKQLSAEINSLIEKRMVKNDPIDDKLSIFRQQVSALNSIVKFYTRN